MEGSIRLTQKSNRSKGPNLAADYDDENEISDYVMFTTFSAVHYTGWSMSKSESSSITNFVNSFSRY
jgi:hypothetical protein